MASPSDQNRAGRAAARIRPMAPADLQTILDMTAEAWSGAGLQQMVQQRHGKLGNEEWWERKRAEIRRWCEANPDGVVVAEIEGRVVGYACFDVDAEHRTGTVSNNAVRPEHRGKGIGSLLHEWILAHFRAAGLQIARVSTLLHDEPARRMYERHGFREIARSIHYTLDLDAG